MADETRFVIDPAGLAEFARSPAMLAGLEEIVKGGQGFAQRVAPRDSGEFADSITTAMVIVDGIPEARLQSNDWRANILEKGGMHDGTMAPAFHTFSKALDYMAGGSGEEVRE